METRSFLFWSPELLDERKAEERAAGYERLHRLGEGAFGEVRLGRSRHSGEYFALKTVGISRQSEGRLPRAIFREIEALKQIHCPNVIRLIDVLPEETHIILVLEHAVTDLGAIISKSQSLLERGVVKHILFMMMEGIRHCHKAGIIHRDIKPSNILVSATGVVKIGDFGLARLL